MSDRREADQRGRSDGEPGSAGVREQLGRRLAELRHARGASQQEVADRLRVAHSSYASWERAENGPRFEQLVALADLFEVALDDLVGRQPAELPAPSERGVRWRLAWSRPSAEKRRAAEIWHALMAGRTRREIAEAQGIPNAQLDQIDRLVQDLVLGEWLEIEGVARCSELERQILDRFLDDQGRRRLRDVVVAKIGHVESLYARYVLLGHVAKAFLGTRDSSGERSTGVLKPGMLLGLCGGFSVSRLVYAYRRGEVPPGVRVAPIAVTPVYERAGVSANSVVGALAYRQYDYGIEATELSFLSDEDAASGTEGEHADDDVASGKKAEPPVSTARQIARRALEDARRVDIAVLGLGLRGTGDSSLAQDPTDVQRADFLWLARGPDRSADDHGDDTVGNILYQPIGADGEPRYPVPAGRLVCSIGLEGLRGMVDAGRRVVVLGIDGTKAGIARAAVVGRYANVLIADDALAEALLRERG